mmetsp:Transcript_23809/g.71533  ORF Transcript_23809/g.71533 Transcript_23809/m.71533 type:complete len:281 (+) Transcript_23809:697-1539(+)
MPWRAQGDALAEPIHHVAVVEVAPRLPIGRPQQLHSLHGPARARVLLRLRARDALDVGRAARFTHADVLEGDVPRIGPHVRPTNIRDRRLHEHGAGHSIVCDVDGHVADGGVGHQPLPGPCLDAGARQAVPQRRQGAKVGQSPLPAPRPVPTLCVACLAIAHLARKEVRVRGRHVRELVVHDSQLGAARRSVMPEGHVVEIRLRHAALDLGQTQRVERGGGRERRQRRGGGATRRAQERPEEEPCRRPRRHVGRRGGRAKLWTRDFPDSVGCRLEPNGLN